MSKSPVSTRKVTTTVFRAKKVHGNPITMLTAYDYPTDRAVDLSGMDSILGGDSLAVTAALLHDLGKSWELAPSCLHHPLGLYFS